MGKFVSRPQRGPQQLIDAGSGKDAHGSSSDIVRGSLHQEDTAMWIEVQDGTSQETRNDTFWEEMARAVFQVSLLIRSAFVKRFKSLQDIRESMKVILSGHSMTEDIGAHTCVAISNNNLSSVNTVSIYVTLSDEPRAEEAIVAATIIIRDMLEGE